MRETTRNRLLLGSAWALLIGLGILWLFLLHPSVIIVWSAVIVGTVVTAVYDGQSNDLPWEFWRCSMWFGIGMSPLIVLFSLNFNGDDSVRWIMSILSAVVLVITAFYSIDRSSSSPDTHVRGRRVVEYTSVEYVSRRTVRTNQTNSKPNSHEVTDSEADAIIEVENENNS